MTPGEREGEGGINELWNALRAYRDDHKDLAGEVRTDRVLAEDRHKQTGEQFREIKGGLTNLQALLSEQHGMMTRLDQGQQSILQTMVSDRQTRIETAAALEAAEKARRDRADTPWVTPQRIVTFLVGVAAVVAFVQPRLPS